VADKLRARGATVRVHDPRAQHNAKRNYPQLEYPPSVEETVVGADIVLHMTEWAEYRNLNPTEISKLVRHKRIFDGRNELDLKQWQSAGWATKSLGRPQ